MPTLQAPEGYESMLFCGDNGSGKSELAKRFLCLYDSWVTVDIKGDFTPIESKREYVIIEKPDDYRLHTEIMRPRKILYRPLAEYNSGAWHDEFLRREYMRARKLKGKKPYKLYVDEARMMTLIGRTTWLRNFGVSGRSLKVGLWTGSQRYLGIPIEVRDQAWRHYIFFLSNIADKKEIITNSNGLVTLDMLTNPDSDYGFLEVRRVKGGRKQVQFFPPVALGTTPPAR